MKYVETICVLLKYLTGIYAGCCVFKILPQKDLKIFVKRVIKKGTLEVVAIGISEREAKDVCLKTLESNMEMVFDRIEKSSVSAEEKRRIERRLLALLIVNAKTKIVSP
jgi:hypothetical protein